jgi:hypothetical protein
MIIIMTLINKFTHQRFYPSKAKAIADRIVSEELQNAAYDEEDAKIWSLNISDKVREAVYGKIYKTIFRCH